MYSLPLILNQHFLTIISFKKPTLTIRASGHAEKSAWFRPVNMHEESRNAIVIAILTLGAVFWIGIIVLMIGRDGMILLTHFPLLFRSNRIPKVV